MKCKLSEKCEFGNLCKDATRHDSLTVLACSSFKTKKPMTEQEYLQSCDTEQLADLMSRMVGCSNCPIPKDGRSCMGTYSGCWHEIIKWLKGEHK